MILLLLITLAEVTELYNTGNKYYAENNFQSAIECYERALKISKNKDIYYNLGNAYFKTGHLGKAILQYRRAYFLNPRDEDILYNLNFLRNFRPDKAMIFPNPFFQFLDRFFHHFSFNETIVLSSITFLFTVIFLSLFIINRNKLFLGIGIIISLFFLYFLISSGLWQAEKNSNAAVVVVNELKAFSGPGEEYKEILIIRDGTEAKIREERNGYYLLQLPGGIGGWVKVDGVEKVLE